RAAQTFPSKLEPGNILGSSRHSMIRRQFLFAKGRTVLRAGTLLNRALPLILAAISIYAAPPTTGEKAPDFQLSTVDGKAVRLSDLVPRGPVVLVVLRGYPGYQCPYCNRQVQDFLQKAPSFAASGAHVVMVYPGPPQNLGSRATEFLTGKTLPENVD